VRRRKVLVLLVVVLAAITTVLVSTGSATASDTYRPPDLRQSLDLDTSWRFFRGDVAGASDPSYDDRAWAAVSVPHTWNAVDGADGGFDYYRGVGWYRRHLTVSTRMAGKMLFLQFDAVNQVADVWVNGTYLGRHAGGYARFRFDATTALRVGGADNVIAVKVTNAYDPDVAPLSADYTFDGGIYRDVSLWAVDRLQVRMLDYAGPGAYLRPLAISAESATVNVTAKLFNNGTARSLLVRTIVTDRNHRIVFAALSPVQKAGTRGGVDVTQTVTIRRPHLWNGLADPYLYQVSVEVRDAGSGTVTDVVTQPLGLRTLGAFSDTGFRLNGHRYPLHGVDLHQDRAGVGWATTPADHEQDFALIKEIGATAVRMAHYQHADVDYTLADRLGLVVWAEIPHINTTLDRPGYTANVLQQLTELIRQNFNHPSIVFWGIGNEQSVDDAPTNALLAKLAGLAHAEDPSRLSAYAAYAGCCVPVSAHTDVAGYNEYFGWYGGSYNDVGRWADTLQQQVPRRLLVISEYGAGASISQHALNPPRPVAPGEFHPEEYQSLWHEITWKQLVARPYILATFVWNMFDFASDGRAEGGQRGINDKGLVTRDRSVRKDAFYWYKANWSTQPTLYITSRRWTSRTAAATELKVYSNAEAVSASLNGVPLPTLTSADRAFRWPVTLRPGPNHVTVTATIDGKVSTDSIVWTLNAAPPPK
jgi:beta-galactosidase